MPTNRLTIARLGSTRSFAVAIHGGFEFAVVGLGILLADELLDLRPSAAATVYPPVGVLLLAVLLVRTWTARIDVVDDGDLVVVNPWRTRVIRSERVASAGSWRRWRSDDVGGVQLELASGRTIRSLAEYTPLVGETIERLRSPK